MLSRKSGAPVLFVHRVLTALACAAILGPPGIDARAAGRHKTVCPPDLVPVLRAGTPAKTVGLGSTAPEIRAALGAPDRIDPPGPYDCSRGGRHNRGTATRYHYNDLTVEFHQTAGETEFYAVRFRITGKTFPATLPVAIGMARDGAYRAMGPEVSVSHDSESGREIVGEDLDDCEDHVRVEISDGKVVAMEIDSRCI